jgi:nitrogen PTS system EIIA component
MQLSVRDVAGLLNVSGNTVYQWIKTGQLSAQQVNGRYRFNRSELLEWATARNLTIRNGLFDERADEPIPSSRLSEALEIGGVFHDVPGTDKPSVLKAVVERMQLPDDVDRNFLCSVLLAREAMGSTAIGDGVAIPHVRNPIVLHVLKPTIALCFLRQPIDFDALDKRPVHALFSMVSPTIRIHLHLLSRLAFALRDPKIKELISSQGARDEILNEIRRLETRMSDPESGRTELP